MPNAKLCSVFIIRWNKCRHLVLLIFIYVKDTLPNADMTKNKGFCLAGPTEISAQRKQLKEIIFSVLPACTEPDLDTGAPFRAQAIIANPPALGRFIHDHTAILHHFYTTSVSK